MEFIDNHSREELLELLEKRGWKYIYNKNKNKLTLENQNEDDIYYRTIILDLIKKTIRPLIKHKNDKTIRINQVDYCLIWGVLQK